MNGAQFYLPRVCFAGGATAFSEDEYQACSGSLRPGALRAFGGSSGAKQEAQNHQRMQQKLRQQARLFGFQLVEIKAQ